MPAIGIQSEPDTQVISPERRSQAPEQIAIQRFTAGRESALPSVNSRATIQPDRVREAEPVRSRESAAGSGEHRSEIRDERSWKSRLEALRQADAPRRVSEAETTVHVTIGRIDVRATPQAAARPNTRSAPQTMSLHDYLQQQSRRGRS
jgi:hypothetical protein